MTLSQQKLYCHDMVEIESGEIFTLCGSFIGNRCRCRLTYYPNENATRVINGKKYQKATYETGYIISALVKVLDLPGEQHFIIDRSQIINVYRCTNAFSELSKEEQNKCSSFIQLLNNSCAIDQSLHGLTGSGALHSIESTSDYDWIIYTRDPHLVQELITSNSEFIHHLTFSMQHVYKKYEKFSELSRSDIDLLFKERWKYFYFKELPISVSFVDPLFFADTFLQETILEERVTLCGQITEDIGCYHSPRIIPINCAGKEYTIFTWLFLYNGAFIKGDWVFFSGRKCFLNNIEYVLIETPQDYICKFSKLQSSHISGEVTMRLAIQEDLPKIIQFLKQPEIDQSFINPLSTRTISIEERVYNNFANGFWLIAFYLGEIIACRGCKGFVDTALQIVEFSTLVVKKEFRSIGLGSLLVHDSINFALKLYSVKWLRLDSPDTNNIFDRVVKKAGFVEIRRFDDNEKRPSGVQTIEYILDCTLCKTNTSSITDNYLTSNININININTNS